MEMGTTHHQARSGGGGVAIGAYLEKALSSAKRIFAYLLSKPVNR
jgi:hypothetical protein